MTDDWGAWEEREAMTKAGPGRVRVRDLPERSYKIPEPPRSGKRAALLAAESSRALADAMADDERRERGRLAADASVAEIRRLAALGIGQTKIAAQLRVPYRVVAEVLEA